ncbi:MAG: hypothetical protein Q9165_003429 [Trypethelium subeluteriae]
MLGRSFFGRLSTQLHNTRPRDVAHLSQKLVRSGIASKLIVASITNYLSHSPRSFHSSIRCTVSESATTTGEPAKARRSKSNRAASKPAPRKKAASGKKSRARKKVVRKTTRKSTRRVVSEKTKARQDADKQRDEIKKLKETALLSPEPATSRKFGVVQFLISEVSRGLHDVRSISKEASARLRSLSPAEREHYNHLVNEKKASDASKHREWIHSYTPERIRQANKARASLIRRLTTTSPNPGHKKYPKFQGRVIALIPDDRTVKGPRKAYTYFTLDRHQSGDMKGVPVTEAAKLIGNEFKALTASEKQKYKNMEEEDYARYKREFKDVYGYDSSDRTRKRSSST